MLGVKPQSFAVNTLKSGQQVGVIGRIQTRNYEDDKGTKHYATEVIAEEVYFADSKREDTETSSNTTTQTTDFELNSQDELPF